MARAQDVEWAEVREDILFHLCECPGACDTEDGVVQWWVWHRRMLPLRRVIKGVLEDLVKEGAVERVVSDRTTEEGAPLGHVLYRAAALRSGDGNG